MKWILFVAACLVSSQVLAQDRVRRLPDVRVEAPPYDPAYDGQREKTERELELAMNLLRLRERVDQIDMQIRSHIDWHQQCFEKEQRAQQEKQRAEGARRQQGIHMAGFSLPPLESLVRVLPVVIIFLICFMIDQMRKRKGAES
ncbi:hypothetical protein KKC44_00590 [Patescibacteria group bacterium]|nr:hypothetical protein [Patescibacteria group bacterium]MBU2259083.1 hypothetical protein [Patescibacteria group bacterium]